MSRANPSKAVRMKTAQVRILALLNTALLVACADATPVARCYELKELRRLGQEERLTDAPDSTAAMAGVLGDVRGVVAGPGDVVFVLDRSTHSIVGFRPDGSIERVIRGGEGEGPGEFRLPMHLASTEHGLSVVDYDLKRITEFDWDGKVLRLTQALTPRPWRHLIRGDTGWITYGAGGSSADPAFHMVNLTNGSVTPGPPLPVEEQAFGTSVGVDFGAGGEILINTARPGVWISYHNGNWMRRGSPLYPQDRAPLTEQTAPQQFRVTPAQHTAGGIATIGDSIVLQGITSLPRPFDWSNPPRRDEYVDAIGVFSHDGRHLATLDLPAGLVTAFLASDRESGRFFLPAREPFPQAVEYTLVQCAAR
jgi:hypothetical protein